MTKVFVASSWKEEKQQEVVQFIKGIEAYEVYDFKEKETFNWKDVSPDWKYWTAEDFTAELEGNELMSTSFQADMTALKGCDICVMVLECGKSAHLELGFAVGSGKRTIILLDKLTFVEAELMYKMADYVAIGLDDLRDILEIMQEN